MTKAKNLRERGVDGVESPKLIATPAHYPAFNPGDITSWFTNTLPASCQLLVL